MDDTATYRRARAGTGTARVLRISALAIAAGFAVWLLSNVLLEVFLAGLIAVILRAVVDTAVRRARIPERAALALVSLLAVAIPLTFSYYLGSRLISETEQLFVQLHRQFEFLRNLYGQTPIGGLIFDQLSPRHAIGAHLSGYAETLATSTVGGLTTLFIIVVISLYFTISPETYLSGTLRLFPIPHRPRARLVLREIGHALRWWTLGQIASMITVGLLTGTGLVLLGVPMAFALAMLAGLCYFRALLRRDHRTYSDNDRHDDRQPANHAVGDGDIPGQPRRRGLRRLAHGSAQRDPFAACPVNPVDDHTRHCFWIARCHTGYADRRRRTRPGEGSLCRRRARGSRFRTSRSPRLPDRTTRWLKLHSSASEHFSLNGNPGPDDGHVFGSRSGECWQRRCHRVVERIGRLRRH